MHNHKHKDIIYCNKYANSCKYVLDWIDDRQLDDINDTLKFPNIKKIYFIQTIDVKPHGLRHVIFYQTAQINNNFFCKRDLLFLLPQLLNKQSKFVFFVVGGDPHFTQKELDIISQTPFIILRTQYL